ncbi:MAG: heavy-metal-associated domain-containing protein [Bacteroidota bacterium]
MKQFMIGILALTFLVFSSVALAAETKKATLGVKGMTCSGCALTVKSKVKKIEGISSIDVDLKAGKATFEYDPEKVSPEQVADEINEMGFKASVPERSKAAKEDELRSEETED